MSKKTKIRASKMKRVSDPKFAHAHKAGAIVEFVQPAKDNKWGAYFFRHYPRSYKLLNKAISAHKQTVRYLNQGRKVALDKTNTRYITDDIRDRLEISSLDYLIYLKLGFEHLIAEKLLTINSIRHLVQRKAKLDWDKLEVVDRYKLVADEINFSPLLPQSLMDLLARRHIAEHPTSDRVYNATDHGWKNNNLAWVLSGEVEGMLDPITLFINDLTEAFDKYKKANDGPVTLKGLERGIKSTDPFKK